MSKKGDVLKYLGGESFLDEHLDVGGIYIIKSIEFVDGHKFVIFNESNCASYYEDIEKYFKNISKERDLILKRLLK